MNTVLFVNTTIGVFQKPFSSFRFVFTMRRLVEIQFVTNFWRLVSASRREGAEQSDEMSSAHMVTFQCEICDGKSLTYKLKRTEPKMVP